MFYYISKILGIFSYTSSVLVFLGLLGFFLGWTRFRRFGRFLTGLALLALLIFGFSPLGSLAVAALEDRFPPANLATIGEIRGIIVLGGSTDTHISTLRDTPLLTDAAERVTVVPGLARRFPQAQLIFTGGVGLLQDQFYKNLTEAELTRRLWLDFGLPEERMVFEGKSRNTVENARFTYDLLKPAPNNRYLLVTSAFHMPRSMALFRKAGFNVEPWPVDYRTGGVGETPRLFMSVSEGLKQTDLGIREWIGLLGYRLTGRTDEFFPAP